MNEAFKKKRKLTIDMAKREIIRSAAKKLFADSGLDKTSVREIARLAGYTTGAIYFHYANKEELYADILRESMDRLLIAINGALPENGDPIAKLVAGFGALVHFYEKNPRDLDLSLYLLNGAHPRGLTPTLNKELNSKMCLVLDIYRTELSRAGIADARLNVEVAGLFDEMIGSLVAAHTGRLKLIGTDLATVVEHHTTGLADRLSKIKRRS